MPSNRQNHVQSPKAFVFRPLSSVLKGGRTKDRRQKTKEEDFRPVGRPPRDRRLVGPARRAGHFIVKRRERRFPERCPLRGSDTPVASRFSERQFPLRRQRMWMDMPSLRRITELEVVLTRQPGGRPVVWSGLPVIVPPFTALTRV